MSQHFADAQDTLPIWDSLKKNLSARNAVTNNHLINSKDYGFITPTILVGKISDSKPNELSEVLQGNPAVIWNLSGRPIPTEIRKELKNQVINAPWVTPGSWTQIPTLDCLLTQCYSIKSWLDIRSDHIAIVHCANGRSRSGILVACLLKYMGAFDNASDAFEFFCSARNLKDLPQIQTVSYNILFENIDKVVDFGGYPNRFPVHLKNLAISGLPADEVPIIEVMDMHGQVYNSQQGDGEKPKWVTEFGDGSFQVCQEILGDFSISCRFGGTHAATKNNSTSIFTYQNNTAFLPFEVVELRQGNLDVNTAYADTLESESFTVHLMLEEPEAENVLPESSPQKGGFGRSNFVLPPYTSPCSKGGRSFEKGLDELCKYHLLEVDQSMAELLEKAGHHSQYIASSLKLSNNNPDLAVELLQKIVARSVDVKSGDNENEKEEIQSSVPFSGTLSASRSSSISYTAIGSDVSQITPTQIKGKRLNVDPFSGLNTLMTDGDLDVADDFSEDEKEQQEDEDDDDDGGEMTPRTKIEDINPGPPCSECCKDLIEKKNQLVPCSACHRQFHAFCLGRRPVPFSIKSTKDRQSRQKYIAQNYRFWRCNMCTTNNLTDIAEAEGTMDLAPRRNSASRIPSPTKKHPMPAISVKTETVERTASWAGPPSGSKISFATTLPVGGAPRSALIALPPKKKPASPSMGMTPLRRISSTDSSNRPSKSTRRPSNELSAPREAVVPPPPAPGSGASWMFKSRMSHSIKPPPVAAPRTQTNHDQVAALLGLLAASGLTMEALLKMGEEKQRETLIAAATIRNSSRLTEQERLQLRRGQAVEASSRTSKRVSMRSMVSFSLPETVQETSESPEKSPMHSPECRRKVRMMDDIKEEEEKSPDPRKAMMAMLAKRGGGGGEESEEPKEAPDPRKAMMAMLAKRGGGGGEESEEPKEAPDPRKAMMAMLAKRGGGGGEESEEPKEAPDPRKAMMAMLAKRGGGGEESGEPKEAPDPRKAMMAMLAKRGGGGGEESEEPKEAPDPRKAMMAMLAKRGGGGGEESGEPKEAPDPRKAMMAMLAKRGGGGDDAGSPASFSASTTVAFKDCPKYGKYFKMMKVGLPKPAVAQKMMSDGVVTSDDEGFKILDKGGDAPSPIPGVGAPQVKAGSEDPRKAMMDILAKNAGAESGGGGGGGGSDTVPLKDCKTYGKYFKMMKVGLPKPAVAQKMMSDGVVTSDDEGFKILDKGGDAPSPIPGVGAPQVKAGSEDPRKAMMDILAKNAGAESGGGGGGGGSDTVPLKDCKTYGKYFKMMKVGLPKPAVAQKMMSDGVVKSDDEGFKILDKGGDAPSPVLGQGGGGGSGGGGGGGSVDPRKNMMDMLAKKSGGGGGGGGGVSDGDKVALKDHPSYIKYFKMLKVGLPKDNVKFKMEQDGIDKDILDRDPESLVSSKDPKAAALEADEADVAVSYHPKYGKYFRMLSVRLPKDAIKAKMEEDGLDPAFLDKNPTELIPRNMGMGGMSSAEMLAAMIPAHTESVTFNDHPQYGKFFKMLKVGLPKDAVKAKMTNEGLNPDYLDMNATDAVPREGDRNKGKSANRIKSQRIKSQRIKSVAVALTALGAGAKGAPKVRKKKLYWKALNVNQLGLDSMWNEAEEDIAMDEAEFNKLFVESDDAPKEKKSDDGAEAKAAEEKKRKKVNLIDAKRGQNAGIALARIKIAFPEVRERIVLMMDEVFTTDQLRYLLEYLPTEEEKGVISCYSGDIEMLGQAEKYMKIMSDFPKAAKHIHAMIYKQQLKVRIAECCATLSTIEGACDDVKMSVGFKKILKTILKVGNQMNDGEKHKGFTLDSLLKLQSAKAFDKKTSILQYVIMLVYRNDEKCLDFPSELTNCAEAARLTLDSAHQEQVALKQGHEASLRVVSDCLQNEASSTILNAMSVMTSFLSEGKQLLEELSAKVDGVKKKFASVLAYFGEESSMSSQDFFTTLTAFISEFVGARDNLERVRKLEKAKEKREKDAAEKLRLKEEKEKKSAVAAPEAKVATASANRQGIRLSPMAML